MVSSKKRAVTYQRSVFVWSTMHSSTTHTMQMIPTSTEIFAQLSSPPIIYFYMVDVIHRRRIAIFSRLSTSTSTYFSFVLIAFFFLCSCLPNYFHLQSVHFSSSGGERCHQICVWPMQLKTETVKKTQHTIKQFHNMHTPYTLRKHTTLIHFLASSHCHTFDVIASKFITVQFYSLV